MHKSSADGLNVSKPTDVPLAASTSVPEARPAVNFATFEFKKIGKPPSLLQRLKDAGPDINMSTDSNEGSRSPSPDLEDELFISESTSDSKDQGPSLFARIAMSKPTAGAIDTTDVNELTLKRHDSRTTNPPSRLYDRGPSGALGVEHHIPSAIVSSDLTKSKTLPAISHSNVDSNLSLSGASSYKHHECIPQTSSVCQGSDLAGPSTPRNTSLNPNANADSSPSGQHGSAESQVYRPLDPAPIDGTPTSSASPEFSPFRDLVNQMNSIMSVHRPINPDVLQLAESCRSQFSELSSSMQTISEIAQHLAKAAQKCVRLVQPFDDHLNAFFDVVEGLHRETKLIDNVKNVVSQMDQQLQIDEQKRREKKLQKAQNEVPISAGSSVNGFTGPPKPNMTDHEQMIAFNEELAVLAARAKATEEGQALRQAKAAEQAAADARMEAEDAANAERYRAAYEITKRKQEELARMIAQKERDSLQEAQTVAEKEIDEKKETEKASRKALLEEKLAAEREERDRRARIEEEERKRKEQADAAIAQQRADMLQEKARQDALKEQEKKRQEVAAEKQLALKENAKVAVAHKRNKASQDSASLPKFSSVSASPYVAPLSVSSSQPDSTKLMPQTAAIKTAQVFKDNGIQTLHRNSLSAGKTSAPALSHALSIGQSVGAPQPHSTLNIPQTGYAPTIQSSSGLPSPPSEMIQPHSVVVHTPSPGNRKKVAAGERNQENPGSSQIKKPPTHANLPVKPFGFVSAVQHGDASVYRQGHNQGNLLVSPYSQISPVSADAQKVNLRSSSMHQGISSNQEAGIKQGPEKTNLSAKSETGRTHKQSASTALTPSIQADSLSLNVKIEATDDIEIPRLSMPPSPSTPKLNADDTAFEITASDSHLPQPVLQSSHYPQNSPKISSNVSRQDLPTETSTNLSSGTRPAQKQVSRATANPQMTLSQTTHSHIGNNDIFQEPDYRKGLSSVSGVYNQPLRLTPAEAESLGPRRRTPRAPQNIDHYSPSPPAPPPPPPRSRTPPTRARQINRRGDHYSPPRSPEIFSAPSRRRPGGGNHSRGVSPVGQGENIRRNSGPSMALEPNSHYARKRLRDDQDHGGPPSRRQRFAENDRATERYEIGQHTLTLPQQPEAQREEWSRVANYSPSPSPESSRPAMLPKRMEANDFDQGQSSYRGGQGHPNMAQHRQPNEYGSTMAQNPSNYGNHEHNPTPYQRQQRQNYRESGIDSQPLLLSRFTDEGRTITSPSEPNQHYPAPQHRPARGRPHKQPNPRSSYHHPSLGQRLNTNHKNSLIHRIEQGPQA